MKPRRTDFRQQRGVTLIEALIATMVLSFGVVGLMAGQIVAANQNAAGARLIRGTMIARDLAARVQQWPYTDSRLANSQTSNDAAIIEGGLQDAIGNTATAVASVKFDREITAAAGSGEPVADSKLDFNGDGTPDFRRFLSVSPLNDPDGNPIGLRLVVTVAWNELGRTRTVNLIQVKYNTDAKPTPGL